MALEQKKVMNDSWEDWCQFELAIKGEVVREVVEKAEEAKEGAAKEAEVVGWVVAMVAAAV